MTNDTPALPPPDLEDVDYELWGQNAKADCWFAEKVRAYGRECAAEAVRRYIAGTAGDENVDWLLKALHAYPPDYPLMRIVVQRWLAESQNRN